MLKSIMALTAAASIAAPAAAETVCGPFVVDWPEVRVVARGEVFSAPIEKGRTRNLTNSSGAHDRVAAWSPDGTEIAYISDADGEDEIWIVDQIGAEPAKQLTDGHSARLFNLAWSPDGDRRFRSVPAGSRCRRGVMSAVYSIRRLT